MTILGRDVLQNDNLGAKHVTVRIGDDLGKGTCCRERGTLVIIRGRGAAVGDNLGENENHQGDIIPSLRTRTTTMTTLLRTRTITATTLVRTRTTTVTTLHC